MILLRQTEFCAILVTYRVKHCIALRTQMMVTKEAVLFVPELFVPVLFVPEL